MIKNDIITHRVKNENGFFEIEAYEIILYESEHSFSTLIKPEDISKEKLIENLEYFKLRLNLENSIKIKTYKTMLDAIFGRNDHLNLIAEKTSSEMQKSIDKLKTDIEKEKEEKNKIKE